MGNCIFCRIVAGEIPANLVLEDEHFFAIRDIAPKAPVHVLVVPREHVATPADLSVWEAERVKGMVDFAVRVADIEGVSETGYRLVINSGPDGGQEVDHLHLHVLGGAPLGEFW